MRKAIARLVVGVLAICWVPLAFEVLYLWLLTAAAGIVRPKVPQARRQRTFRIVIPAHNEELILSAVLQRLMSVAYPSEKFEVVVVADNCTDRTAEVARASGTRVIERLDPQNRGKGYALAYAFALLRQEPFDAYVVIDADTLVEPNLLEVLNRYLDAGHRVIQANYDVLNPFETPRTALMYVALKIFHYVRPLGRNALGASIFLMGNGMCFAKAVIDQHPWNAVSLTEDLEYSITLLQHHERIVLAPDATILSQMPTTGAQATSQRTRWEAGRLYVARRVGLRLLWQGFRRGDLGAFDSGMDLVIPPLAGLALLIGGGTAAAVSTAVVGRTDTTTLLARAWLALAGALATLVIAAMGVARLPWQAYRALVSAPAYVAWKFWIYLLMVTKRGPQTWVRTTRTPIRDQ